MRVKVKILVTQLCLTLWDPMDYIAHQIPLSMNSPGKNTRVDCHALLQGIFLTQGSNPCPLSLLHLAGEFFTTSAIFTTYLAIHSDNFPFFLMLSWIIQSFIFYFYFAFQYS